MLLFSWQFAAKEFLSQPIEAAEVMVFDIPAGLTELGGNFIQGVTLYKEKL
jgi:hypothetical protein